MKRLLIGLGILFALAAGVQFFWSRDLRAEWEARLDKLRAAGEVVDYADLEPPPVPHDRNAAPVLLEAQQAYRQAPGEPWLLHAFERSEWTDEIWEEARVFFAARESYARLLEQAAAMPDCWFDMDFSDPIRMRVPLFRIIMDANSFLQYRAVLEARDGEPVRAARSLLLMMDTGNRLDRNTLISYLVRLVNQGIAARTLQELAAQPGFRAREVRALLEPRFARCEDPDGLQIALRAERAAAIWYIRFLLDGGDVSEVFGGDRNPVNRASAPLMRPLIYKGGIEYLDAMETALPLMTEPFWESLGPAGAIADRYGSSPRFAAPTFRARSVLSGYRRRAPGRKPRRVPCDPSRPSHRGTKSKRPRRVRC